MRCCLLVSEGDGVVELVEQFILQSEALNCSDVGDRVVCNLKKKTCLFQARTCHSCETRHFSLVEHESANPPDRGRPLTGGRVQIQARQEERERCDDEDPTPLPHLCRTSTHGVAPP